MSTHLKPPAYFEDFDSDDVKIDPPKPWSHDTICIFGQTIKVKQSSIPPLSDRNIQCLYDKSGEPSVELQRLIQECLTCFANLLSDVQNNRSTETSIKHLEVLFLNLHHLLNEFRPHQARETIKSLLMLQTTQRTQLADELAESMKTVDKLLQDCIETAQSVVDTSPSMNGTHESKMDVTTD